MPHIPTDVVALIGLFVALLQTVLLALAGGIAWFQVREATKSRYLEALVRMFDDFGSRDAYFDADNVLGLPQRIEDYTPDELELATWVTRVNEKIAFLVESGMMPAEFVIPLYSRRILWTWDALQPFIKNERRLRDTDGAYRMGGDGRYFEKLADRALRYRRGAFNRSRANPPIPQEYRDRLRALVDSGASVRPRSDTAE